MTEENKILSKMNPEIKDELLNLTENISKDSVISIFKIANILIKESGTKLDDLLLPALPFIEEKVLNLLDNIHK